MALNAGTKPTSWDSTLSGLSLAIYNSRISEGIIPSESKLSTTVGDQTYSETDAEREGRVLKAKLDAWVVASSTITEITTNGEVNDISSIIQASTSVAVAPNDGGLVAFQNFGANLTTNNPLQKGTIS